jgi:large subunit ribosomal protein L17
MSHLAKNFEDRKALVRGLVNALIRNESIETTEAKAQAMKEVVDGLITKAKKNDLHNFRMIMSFLDDEELSNKLVKTIAPSLKNKNSGYVKTTKLGNRKGDNAMIVRVEFSDKISKAENAKEKNKTSSDQEKPQPVSLKAKK